MGKRYTIEELEAIHNRFTEMLREEQAHFLLVDPRISARRGLKNALLAAGVEDSCVIEANDAMDATIQASRVQSSFVVFTELKLPDTNAEKLVERIKSKPGHDKDTFILVTAEKNKARLEKAMQSGISSLLPKPINETEVASLAKNLRLV